MMNDFDDIMEKTFRDNKAIFEEDAPPGHFERFEQRLNQQHIRPFYRQRKFYLRVAAAVVFVLLVGNQVRMYMDRPTERPATLSSVSPEYREAEFYYTTSIDEGMRHWKRLTADGEISPEEQDMMKQEIAEFDATYKRLQEELAANPEDERVINAMLELYQTRLSIINLIINKLEDIKKLKENNHDESEI